ncbi:MAG: hypothetical protein IJB79_01115 [Candidatus Gastranaerophilales bacterium]|nr:hypothetical protein [Candidatus Gastranaerophilales bacterium]
MLSKYFQIKTKEENFINHINSLIENHKNKKILFYGAGEAFLELNKTYKFNEKLDIVAIADQDSSKKIENFNLISPQEIKNYSFDKIIITTESNSHIKTFLLDLKIPQEKIETLFIEDFKDERLSFIYLEKNNFEDHLKKLNHQLQGKKIVIYGAGVFFQAIKKFYDLSKLNIIAISDQSFSKEETKEYMGYMTISPNKIKSLNPDCVLVATKIYITIIEHLHQNLLYRSGIKIAPLVKKPLGVLLKEIWK